MAKKKKLSEDKVYALVDRAVDAAYGVVLPLLRQVGYEETAERLISAFDTHARPELQYIATGKLPKDDIGSTKDGSLPKLRSLYQKSANGDTLTTVRLSNRELDTVLAALRFWQAEGLLPRDDGKRGYQVPVDFADLALEHGSALSPRAIDKLCERINFAD